jgi:serine protease Do
MLNRINGSARKALMGAAALSALLVFSPLLERGATAAPAAPAVAARNLPDFSDLAAAVSPAVVQITVTTTEVDSDADVPPQFRGTPFAPFFGQRQGQPHKAKALGSGFVVDPKGYIVTNFHVAGRADDIQVVFADGSRLPAKRVGADERTDLALLKVEAPKPLVYVELGDSDKVRIGQSVLAVGNPFGLGGTVTAGIVSARSRDIGSGPYDDYLQIDAAINQGNSGGPTFDVDGKVVGVNTAIYSPNGGSVGLGFAIPSNIVRKVVDQLRDHGRVDRAWMGVQTQAVDEALAAALKLPAASGALVSAVQKDSPAAAAGLKRGDVILSLDGSKVDSPRELSRRVADLSADTRVSLDVWRDGRRTTNEVRLGALPADDKVAANTPDAKGDGPALGIQLARTPQGEVVVAGVLNDGPADQAGLKPGDRVVEVDKQRVRTPDDVVKALHKARAEHREAIAMYLQRGGEPLYLAVPLRAAKS